MTQQLVMVYEHIEIDSSGIPMIAGTTMKVVELVTAHLAHGWSPEELHFQHPYLSLGQIYAALAYYWDHKLDVDTDIERRQGIVERIQAQAGPSEVAARLRLAGKLA